MHGQRASKVLYVGDTGSLWIRGNLIRHLDDESPMGFPVLF